MQALSLRKLVRRFGDLVAVDNVDLDIEEGGIYGLLGPNGAGKSTIIHLTCGLLKADSGSISVFGADTRQEADRTRRSIGMVPQDIALYPDLTALENVMFFAGLYETGRRKGGAASPTGSGLTKPLKTRAMEALSFVGLEEYAGKFPKTFSGGMKRRLNIACAIAHAPKLIIMDEPTVGIDPQSRNHILDSVQELNRRGSTIIYTSHYMEEVEALCSRIAIMDHGKVIAEGTAQELTSLVSDTGSVAITLESVKDLDLASLKGLLGVRHVELEENTVRIDSTHDVRNLDKIIALLSDRTIRHIESKTPDLETVFLSLTGRTLRDN